MIQKQGVVFFHCVVGPPYGGPVFNLRSVDNILVPEFDLVSEKTAATNFHEVEIPDLTPGDFVKVSIDGETFWCRIMRTNGDGSFVCIVNNDLLKTFLHGLVINNVVLVNVANILDTLSAVPNENN